MSATINVWDRARMDAGISAPGFPHEDILHAATRLYDVTVRSGKSFDMLSELERVHWLERGARTVLNKAHPLHPDRTVTFG